jgi:hypothetical protein
MPAPLAGPGTPGVPGAGVLVDELTPAVPLAVVPAAPFAEPALFPPLGPPLTCASAVVAETAVSNAIAMKRVDIKHLRVCAYPQLNDRWSLKFGRLYC